jgi:glycine oxidase
MLDFIIVGRGLAANTLALRLKEHQLSFSIIGDQDLSNCSRIAAGLWNPVVFKRMTNSWKAEELISELKQFYTSAEAELGIKFYHERVIIKPFFSEEEKVFWQKRSKGELKLFLDEKIHSPNEEHTNLLIPDTYGIVNNCGNIDVPEFLNACEKLNTGHIVNEVFDHSLLQIEESHVTYKNLTAKNIIFCEGHLVKNNPFFNWLPMNPVKGEILDLEVKDIKLENEILNHNAFIFKLKDQRFKMGATYDWDEMNEIPTEKGLTELKEKLKGLITCPYTITKHQAGIRPSTLDRRPIIGAHPQYKNLFVFNGLGTKGVMLAPYLSKNFVYFYLNKGTIHTEVNIKRYYPKFRND